VPNQMTADDVRQYALCPYGLYLDLHGPQQERAEAHAFLDHLRDLGVEHERAVRESLPHLAVPAGSLGSRRRPRTSTGTNWPSTPSCSRAFRASHPRPAT
jgi:hypothetical protein